jgi:hypothetical protein
MSVSDNTIPIEAWNTILVEKFCRFRFVLTQGLSDHSTELLRRHPYPVGVRVLDIGCGFGDTTQLIAHQLGPDGAAVGVDCASNFVTAAARDAAEAGSKGASFLVACSPTCFVGPMTRRFPGSALCSSTCPGWRCATSARRCDPVVN